MTSEQFWNARKKRYPFYVTTTPDKAPRPEAIARTFGEFVRVPMKVEGRPVVNWGFASRQDAESFVSKFASTGKVKEHS